MSALQQKTRQIQSQQIEQTEPKSLLQTGTWSKVFPKQQNTETKSCTFVKKLMAVAISNITYLRSIFPENVFSNRSLDGLPLKILKENTGCEAAENLVSWLRGAFEALEKRYLRELMLVIYLDPEDSNNVHEMYTFRFGYSDGDRAECQILQGFDKKQVHKITDDDLYKATQMMLRNIIVLVQGLGPLPDSAYMTMKLTYYDEITPLDYEPQGFSPTEWTPPQLPDEAVSLNSGEVSTNFHTLNCLKLRVKAIPMNLLIKESQEGNDKTAAITNSLSVSESETEERRKEIYSQQYVGSQNIVSGKSNNTVVLSDTNIIEGSVCLLSGKPEIAIISVSESETEKKMNEVDQLQNVGSQNSISNVSHKTIVQANANIIEESVSLLSGKSDIKCVCQSVHEDNLMLACSICQTFQHGACYRIVLKSDIPEKHICVPCSLDDNNLVCTDRRLAKMASNEAASATCIFRRVLASLLYVKTVSIYYLKETLGINKEYAGGIMAKLVKDKIVVEPISGEEHIIDGELLRETSLPKYLGIKHFKVNKQRNQINCKGHGNHILNQSKDIKKEVKENKGLEKDENKIIGQKDIKTTIKRGNKRKANVDTEQQKKENEHTSTMKVKSSKMKASTVKETVQLV